MSMAQHVIQLDAPADLPKSHQDAFWNRYTIGRPAMNVLRKKWMKTDPFCICFVRFNETDRRTVKRARLERAEGSVCHRLSRVCHSLGRGRGCRE